MRSAWLVIGVSLLLAGKARAEEEATPRDDVSVRSSDVDSQADDPADGELDEAAPRPHLQVLGNPYDLASFYRSSPPSFGYVPPMVAALRGPESAWGATPREDPYSIASYYRGDRDPAGYSQYWSHPQAGTRRPWPGRGRGATQSLPGEVSLMFPTFLAAVGPLNDGFFFAGY
jgi:hypothetical protein